MVRNSQNRSSQNQGRSPSQNRIEVRKSNGPTSYVVRNSQNQQRFQSPNNVEVRKSNGPTTYVVRNSQNQGRSPSQNNIQVRSSQNQVNGNGNQGGFVIHKKTVTPNKPRFHSPNVNYTNTANQNNGYEEEVVHEIIQHNNNRDSELSEEQVAMKQSNLNYSSKNNLSRIGQPKRLSSTSVRKSESRFYRYDKNGVKQYVDQNEQANLEMQ